MEDEVCREWVQELLLSALPSQTIRVTKYELLQTVRTQYAPYKYVMSHETTTPSLYETSSKWNLLPAASRRQHRKYC